MKTKILCLVFLGLSSWGFSQHTSSDLIIKMNGDSLRGKITNIGPDQVTYAYPNETLTYTISKNGLKEIQFASGRIEKVNDPIVIKGEEDWEKVKIAVLPSEVTGLKQVGRIYAVGRPNFGRSLAKKEQIALDKARKEAASKGCHLILIESRNLDTDNDLILTAVIYSF